jgi:predicted transcriptional regulator
MKNFKNYTIFKHASCLEALKKLNIEKSNQTLFVLDENEQLVGTVTDGDIRRGLIRGLNIDTEIQEFCCHDFSFISGKINVP